jgi:hypothetical protein
MGINPRLLALRALGVGLLSSGLTLGAHPSHDVSARCQQCQGSGESVHCVNVTGNTTGSSPAANCTPVPSGGYCHMSGECN